MTAEASFRTRRWRIAEHLEHFRRVVDTLRLENQLPGIQRVHPIGFMASQRRLSRLPESPWIESLEAKDVDAEVVGGDSLPVKGIDPAVPAEVVLRRVRVEAIGS